MNDTTPDHIATALAAVVDEPKPVTVADIIRVVDELAVTSSPSPRSKITRTALIAQARDAFRTDIGSSGPGRGHGNPAPVADALFTLWEDVTARIEALHEDLEGEAPASGSHEQILLAWSRDLLAADTSSPAGLNQAALDYAWHRVTRIRDLIADHFDPPRIGEILGAACVACGETTVLLTIDGEDIPAPTMITIRRGDQPLTVHCRHCNRDWSTEDLDLLNLYRWAGRRVRDQKTALTAKEWQGLRLALRAASKAPGLPGAHADGVS